MSENDEIGRVNVGVDEIHSDRVDVRVDAADRRFGAREYAKILDECGQTCRVSRADAPQLAIPIRSNCHIEKFAREK
jgi:hypothetical protein